MNQPTHQNAYIQNLLQQGQYQEVLQLLKSQAGGGQDVASRAIAAQCYHRLGRFQESVQELSEALRQSPEQAQLYSDRGVSYFMLGEFNTALQDFDQALALEPRNPYRYSSRAYVKDASGDTKGAIDDYQQAIALDPEDAIAYNNLGLLMEKLGYQQQAQQYFGKADQLEKPAGQTATSAAPTETVAAPKPAAKRDQQPVAPQPKNKLSLGFFGQTLKSVFTTRKGFSDFLQFWFGKKSNP